jgi:hypothetical protein
MQLRHTLVDIEGAHGPARPPQGSE